MERIDDTGFGGIRVIQHRGLGYGVDAVLLAAFAAGETGAKGLPKGVRIADLGTGSGVVAFILHHKLGGAVITGYDVRSEAVERAEKACIMNGLDEDIGFVCSDVRDIDAEEVFDAVVTNPPYFRKTPDEPGAADPDDRYIARHETTAVLRDFVVKSAAMLKEGGSLYMVHRPDRLADIFIELRTAGLEPKELQLVVPSAGKAANIALVHAVRGGGPELRMLPEIAVHEEGGGYTSKILHIYGR